MGWDGRENLFEGKFLPGGFVLIVSWLIDM